MEMDRKHKYTCIKCLNGYSIQTVHKTRNRNNGMLAKLKQNPTEEHQTHIMYKIDCGFCPESYIGQNKQYFIKKYTTMNIALRVIMLMLQQFATKCTFENCHKFDFGNANTIDRKANYGK